MLSLKTKITVASQIDPDVKYVLRKMTERRRAARELEFAPLYQKALDLDAKGVEASKLAQDSGSDKDFIRANNEASLFAFSEWYPAWIKWGIAKIDGLTIDDEPATIEKFCEFADEELILEAFRLIQEQAGLGDAERKNSQSLGTSAKPEDSQILSTSATTAEPSADGTPAATAASTSPSE
jgi:hypothetical protein